MEIDKKDGDTDTEDCQSDILDEKTDSNLDKPLAFAADVRHKSTTKVDKVESENLQEVINASKTTVNCDVTLGTTPPLLSQFSNVITKSETRKGVQKNPRRMKKPKVTYGRSNTFRCQKAAAAGSSDSKQQSISIQPRKKVTGNDKNDDYAVFDFCSGELGKDQGDKETPNVEVASSQNTVDKLISPPLNVRRSRNKRRRTHVAYPSKKKRCSSFSENTGMSSWFFTSFDF